MKICVLQADYSTTDVDYKNYDPPRNLSGLLPADQVDHVFLNKLTTYQQLKELSKKNYDVYINLCEGYLDWSVPSIDVIYALDLLNLPYTGPNINLYDPPKTLMKYVAYCVGVNTPNYIEYASVVPLETQINKLHFPLFLKPAKAGDSLGIDEHSVVNNLVELEAKVTSLLKQGFTEILIEEYIAGREFTVLVAANAGAEYSCTVFKPVEYIFPGSLKFKTYALKTSELHTDANIPCEDDDLENKLRTAAADIFNEFSGVGYARLDFRVDANNELYFLEINFTCSVFYDDGYEGSADYILKYDPAGKSGFLMHIIKEGIARHALKQKKYKVKGNSINGYGIFARLFLTKGEVLFKLEEAPLRIVTKRYVETNWLPKQLKEFREYAYPISSEVYIIWDKEADKWAPQNHSCDPNTAYAGLNLIAIRDINTDEELTLDYGDILNETQESFNCTCGSTNCRKIISGKKGNSITSREEKL